MPVRAARWPALVVVISIAAGCSDDDGTTASDTPGAASTASPKGTGPAATSTASTSTAGTSTAGTSTAGTSTAGTSTASTSAAGTSTGSSALATTSGSQPIPVDELELAAFAVPAGSRPHDVAPAVDGGVWYTAQGAGELGWLDPATGATRHTDLGDGSRPHGVIVGPDGAAWITDGGLDAIVRVDPSGTDVTAFPLPDDRSDANLNTAAFAADGRLWFTGQDGIVGVLDPATGEIAVYDSPAGRGPYGITATPTGQIWFASLAGSYVGRIADDGSVLVVEPPTPGQGARRVWSDSDGAIWVSEWNAGQLSRYVPSDETWTSWPLPGDDPSAYAVYVDGTDIVWVSDFGGNAIHRFDPATETFATFPLPSSPGDVRQLLGRPGEVWGAESAADRLVVIRRRP